jgi:hypothetical protein
MTISMNNIWYLLALFVILDLALVTFVVVSKSRRSFNPEKKKKYLSHWKAIPAMAPKESVIEADKLLDEILSYRGYKGTLGDKLGKAGPAFTNVQDVWHVHKMRNRLVHELGMKITKEEADSALKKFERAFKDLGLL